MGPRKWVKTFEREGGDCVQKKVPPGRQGVEKGVEWETMWEKGCLKTLMGQGKKNRGEREKREGSCRKGKKKKPFHNRIPTAVGGGKGGDVQCGRKDTRETSKRKSRQNSFPVGDDSLFVSKKKLGKVEKQKKMETGPKRRGGKSGHQAD